MHPSYRELFLQSTKNSSESIFLIPRSIEYGIYNTAQYPLPRNVGGYGAPNPTWDLLAAYTCTDGLPIDESPLFDPQNPFKNRDPRCTATIVEFGTRHLGFDYNPHPDAVQVMNYNTGRMQTNNDARVNAQFASYNGLVWKKGIDETWLENGMEVAFDKIIVRYADVLLMYAEAKNELGEMDETVWNTTIRAIRQRAGFTAASALDFPGGSKEDIMTHIRYERRIEFAGEGTYYNDLRRWKRAEEEMANLNIYRYDGVQIGTRNFNKDRDYWWPVPASQIEADPALRPNNPGW